MNAKNKERTPDILGSIMGESIKPETTIIIKPESNKKAANKESNNYGLQENNNYSSGSKEKITFNLSIALLDNLEDAWIQLRRQFKGQQRISKTLIVELALEMILKDFEQHNEASELFKNLSKE